MPVWLSRAAMRYLQENPLGPASKLGPTKTLVDLFSPRKVSIFLMSLAKNQSVEDGRSKTEAVEDSA